MERKTGIFICKGCDICTRIDTDQLAASSADETVRVVRGHSALCSASGYQLIMEAIGKEDLNAVILAACSPREKSDVFTFPDSLLTERVNLREQVAWSLEGDEQDRQLAAQDYIRMAVARLKSIRNPQPFIPKDLSDEILVVGAGITGITAALEGAKAGYKVHLIEKEAQAGGWSARLHRQMPSAPPYETLREPVYLEALKELESTQNIVLRTSTTIEKIEGQPGDFTVKLSTRGEESLKVGAVVSAMGWKPYDPTRLSSLGYGLSDRIVTNVEFEEKIKADPKGKLPGRILFVQCAGSRNREHLPYCSNFCCGTSLKQAKYIRESNPDSSVFIIYKDIRTPGTYEGLYKSVQADDQVFFTKGEVQAIDIVEDGLSVVMHNTLLGEEVSLKVDLVVLATGMVPAGTDDLNLSYRQGRALPELKYKFPDSHFICFPYETRRTGIYAAGCVRAPMDITSSEEDAAGAMLKAIQCIEATRRGEAVHPRSGDISYPELYMERCTDCKRCTEECPFGSYDETEKGTPQPNPTRCRRCGICMGSCPERVISFADYSVNSISAMIKAVEIPDEFEEKPRILVFVCENDAYPAFDMAAQKGLKWNPCIRVIPVRCIGSINKVWISDALSCGYDGILQIGCKPGDDYQCHFIHGSELTETRGENIQETLQTMMLEPERIRTEFVEITEYNRIPEIISEYLEEIELIGPNPFKGM
ncbi:MAG: FAD-dependent oxidoreductase [Bacteroidales bacterium]|nr:FAD-dependent oxidoreductase [Bacteroidales bacterium]